MDYGSESAEESQHDDKAEKEQDIENLRKILLREHMERLEQEKIKAKENPGSISKKKQQHKEWRKGKKKPRKQKWDLAPSSLGKKFKGFKFTYKK